MRPRHVMFKNVLAKDMSFDDDLIVLPKKERSLSYIITEQKSRIIKKFSITGIYFTMKVKRAMEVETL